MGLTAITLITIVIIALAFSYLLVPDLVRYCGIESKRIYRKFTASQNNIGEVVTVLVCSILIGLDVFVFYKGVQNLIAYCLSDNLFDFFIKSRGVFSSSGVKGQNPFIISNFLYGSILNPLIQLLSIYVLVEVVKGFMLRLNKKFESKLFSATSLVYFSSFGILIFILFDIVSYLQSVSFLNTFANIVFLTGSKLAYLIIAFGVWHVQLLKNENYVNALFSDLKMNRFEKTLITKPLLLLTFTYLVSVSLNLPLFLGLQWNGKVWMVLLSLLGGIGLFFVLLKFSLSKGYNFLGVYMLDENREHPLSDKWQFNFLKSKTALLVLTGISLFSLAVSAKGFFFYVFYLLLFCAILFILIFSVYGITSLLNRSKIYWTIALQMVYSSVIALSPLLVVLLLIITVFSRYPKKVQEDVFDNYQTAIVDSDGNLIYKSANDSENPSIPIAYEDLPEFLIKTLTYKEDKALFKQNSLFFNRTNWHGTSINFLVGRGGSNINQQLIKNLAFKGFFPQEFQRKYSEAIASYQLSMSMKPEATLTNYVNNVSFNGGSGHTGIVNASYFTFGRNVTQLNELEILYLIFTLHRGSSFKTNENIIPYKEVHLHSSEIKEKLLVYAENWYQKGLLSKKEIKKLEKQKLGFTNSKYSINNSASKNTFLQNQIPVGGSNGLVYTSTLNQKTNDRILNAVEKFETRFHNVMQVNGCDLYSSAIVVDVSSGSIIGHYGGEGVTDLTQFKNGNPISSGIKPFLFIELLEAGFKFNDVLLYDGQIKGKRTPKNYSKRYSNKYVGINEILGKSLNAPVVNIREVTNPLTLFGNVEGHFSEMGISKDGYLDLENPKRKNEHEINYGLGSRNMNLLDIVQAYQALFNGGKYIELSAFSSVYNPLTGETEKVNQKEQQIYSQENADLIAHALTSAMESGGTGTPFKSLLPENVNFYAKTGTSDGARHGYTVLFDGNNTLIVSYVSYGRVENENLSLGVMPIPFESGGRTAGILAAFIYSELQRK